MSGAIDNRGAQRLADAADVVHAARMRGYLEGFRDGKSQGIEQGMAIRSDLAEALLELGAFDLTDVEACG